MKSPAVNKSRAPLPDVLRNHSHHLRVHSLRGNPFNDAGEFVLLWLHHAIRAEHNAALDVAIALAHSLDKPLLVYQGLGGAHRYNSDRQHRFILEGAAELSVELRQRGIRYVFNLQQDPLQPSPLRALYARAVCVVCEDFPAPPFPRWSAALARFATGPVFAVDAACVLPLRMAKQRFDRAFSFRAACWSAMQAALRETWPEQPYLGALSQAQLGFDEFHFTRAAQDNTVHGNKGQRGDLSSVPLPRDLSSVPLLRDLSAAWLADAIAACKIDHSIPAVSDTVGGSAAGYARWAHFKAKGLRQYAARRNDAADHAGVSRMSAYLHHGHVSAFRLAQEALQQGGAGAEKFLDELLIWRELSYHFCAHQAQPERLSALPVWAQQTLNAHALDVRKPRYHAEQLEHARTHQPLWNAAQISLLRHGELHNNVRMSWAKGIAEWSSSPKQALKNLIDLNHRYALDGNNPNSYGGLLWALGLFDRPFSPEQAVLGSVRPRSLDQHQARVGFVEYSKLVERAPHRTANPPEIVEVCVVGAGMAGASLARALHDQGVRVCVLEKSRGAGGRMSTRRVRSDTATSAAMQAQYDHGAQYFTARDPRFARRVKQWCNAGVVAPWSPRIAELSPAGLQIKSSQSGDRVQRYVALPAQSALPKHLLEGVSCRFDSQVARIEKRANRWQLYDQSEALLCEAHLLALCVPSVQAAQLLASSTLPCGRGDSACPTAAAFVAQANMQPCWALMIELPRALEFPERASRFDAAFVNGHEALSWIARDSAKPARPRGERWVAHAHAAFSAQHLEQDVVAVTQVLLEQFFALLSRYGIASSEPIAASAHRWRYALGGREDVNVDAHFFDPELALGLAGDWCGQGRVEGAYLSGSALAGKLLSHSLRSV